MDEWHFRGETMLVSGSTFMFTPCFASLSELNEFEQNPKHKVFPILPNQRKILKKYIFKPRVQKSQLEALSIYLMGVQKPHLMTRKWINLQRSTNTKWMRYIAQENRVKSMTEWANENWNLNEWTLATILSCMIKPVNKCIYQGFRKRKQFCKRFSSRIFKSVFAKRSLYAFFNAMM